MIDTHYLNPKLAEIYDTDSPWSIDRDFYLSLAGPGRQSVLDLGCGTGLLADAYAAKGHDVTGVDPAIAMLEVARRKPRGQEIDWVHASAEAYRSEKRFDLIVMTGHAFQALLEDDAIAGTLRTMRRQLKSGGRVVFESRNPSIDWAAAWNYDIAFETSGGTVHEARRFLAMKGDRMTFDLFYRFPDEEFVSRSELRFLSCDEISERMEKSSLRVEKILGDWDGRLFDERQSQEMIFVASSL